jgi:hypothetical protein
MGLERKNVSDIAKERWGLYSKIVSLVPNKSEIPKGEGRKLKISQMREIIELLESGKTYKESRELAKVEDFTPAPPKEAPTRVISNLNPAPRRVITEGPIDDEKSVEIVDEEPLVKVSPSKKQANDDLYNILDEKKYEKEIMNTIGKVQDEDYTIQLLMGTFLDYAGTILEKLSVINSKLSLLIPDTKTQEELMRTLDKSSPKDIVEFLKAIKVPKEEIAAMMQLPKESLKLKLLKMLKSNK